MKLVDSGLKIRVCAILVATSLLLSCTFGSEKESLISGYITGIGIVEGGITSITLKQDSGAVKTFDVDLSPHFAVSIAHLEYHQELQDPVTLQVLYVKGSVVVKEIRDRFP